MCWHRQNIIELILSGDLFAGCQNKTGSEVSCMTSVEFRSQMFSNPFFFGGSYDTNGKKNDRTVTNSILDKD